MNTDRIARELKKIPLVLQKDALHWNKIILEGVDYIQSYANICAKIFKREFNVKKSNSLRKIGQIKRQTLRNIRQINKRRKELKESVRLLNIIQSRTQVMYERVRYWSNDELLQEYDLESSLAAGNMLELLRFLTERYNLEWEALEMVIRKWQRSPQYFPACLTRCSSTFTFRPPQKCGQHWRSQNAGADLAEQHPRRGAGILEHASRALSANWTASRRFPAGRRIWLSRLSIKSLFSKFSE